jgi:uncharacterized domain HDIG
MNSPQDWFFAIQDHLLNDEAPSRFLNPLPEEPGFREYPFSMLARLRETEQSPRYHPEGNVWNHTMLVVDEAAREKARSKNPAAFLWAALLHDIGKPDTTRVRRGRVTSYGHDKAGARLAERFLSEFTDDRELIRSVAALVRWHMQALLLTGGLPFGDVAAMKRQTDPNEVALLGLCDRLGRVGADRGKEEANIRKFLQKCGMES